MYVYIHLDIQLDYICICMLARPLHPKFMFGDLQQSRVLQTKVFSKTHVYFQDIFLIQTLCSLSLHLLLPLSCLLVPTFGSDKARRRRRKGRSFYC